MDFGDAMTMERERSVEHNRRIQAAAIEGRRELVRQRNKKG